MGDRDKRPSGAATRNQELRDTKDTTRTGKREKKENGRPEGIEPRKRKKEKRGLYTYIFRRRF
jgi:hypothetical protein